ncbi:apg9-domain-containing protein [Ceraceosorus bombacis]|uniref:Autophagy-related protein 9 n=1 Tax=Ceraceosorus bombacis TaxID=401625 RepID=A0A0P1BS86_9BASI|nr:apg9-domain-containing protein [Ceraceosorus bombacis]
MDPFEADPLSSSETDSVSREGRAQQLAAEHEPTFDGAATPRSQAGASLPGDAVRIAISDHPASSTLDVIDASSSEATPSSSVRLNRFPNAGPTRPSSSTSRRSNREARSHIPASPSSSDSDEAAADAALLSDPEAPPSVASRSRSDGAPRRRSRRDKTFLERIREQAAKITAADVRASRMSGAMRRDGRPAGALQGMSRKERALWAWANVDDLDAFLCEVYDYYTGKGIYAIALSRILNLLTVAFVLGFSIFLTRCVDYHSIKHDGKLSEVVVPSCVAHSSGATLLLLILSGMLYAWQLVQFGSSLSRLRALSAFYEELLGVPEADLASIPWSSVVTRLRELRNSHPTAIASSASNTTAQRGALDAHSVANRILRRSNYLIALFNKDLLNLRVPLPFFRKQAPSLTRAMEWNLSFCLLGFVFDRKGQVRKQFLDERFRPQLIEGLKRRFIFMAILNAIFAPFIVLALLVYSFFRYFEEYHQDPTQIGGRQYTRLARWKFREFNELPHLFTRRCHASYPFASRYVNQFPKELTAQLARFVSFVAGSFMAVLVVASIIDPDLFVHFDVTPGRTTLFYIGVFGAILAISRGMIPDDRLVFEPEVLMQFIVQHTHYCPQNWESRFHSSEVHAEFGQLYKLKIYIFVEELLSVLVTPFVLWKSLPSSASAIIDFFRQFTLHVDGIGYVCSFAVFAKNDKTRFGEVPNARKARSKLSTQAKMEQSLLGFAAANPDWAPPADTSASLFLSQAIAAQANAQSPRMDTANESASADLLAFTPANSTMHLAMRSQLYDNAYSKALQASTSRSSRKAQTGSTTQASGTRLPETRVNVAGTRSASRSRGIAGLQPLQVVDENPCNEAAGQQERASTLQRPGPRETDESFTDTRSIPADDDDGVDPLSASSRIDFGTSGDTGLRGLLQHAYGTRW